MDKLGRIKLAIQYVISSGMAKNNTDVGKMLGYSTRSSFSQMTNGYVNVPRWFSERFCNQFPAVSFDWLESGKGTMLIAESAKNNGDDESNGQLTAQMFEQLRKVIEHQSEMLQNERERSERLIGIIEHLSGKKK